MFLHIKNTRYYRQRINVNRKCIFNLKKDFYSDPRDKFICILLICKFFKAIFSNVFFLFDDNNSDCAEFYRKSSSRFAFFAMPLPCPTGLYRGEKD